MPGSAPEIPSTGFGSLMSRFSLDRYPHTRGSSREHLAGLDRLPVSSTGGQGASGEGQAFVPGTGPARLIELDATPRAS